MFGKSGNQATCLECEKRGKKKVFEIKRGNTSTIIRHAKAFHKACYDEVLIF
jgi:hypothetical protein